MILSIITAIICFIAAIKLFSPYYSKFPLLRPIAVYLFFQGIITLASYLSSQLWPTSTVVTTINYLGTILFIGFYILVLFITAQKSKRKKKKQTKVDE